MENIRYLRGLALLIFMVLIVSGCGTTAVREAHSPSSSSPRQTTLLWKVEFNGGSSNPVIRDAVLYVGSQDGAVYAFVAKNGKVKWRFQTGEGLTSGPEIITVPRGTSLEEMIGAALSRVEKGKKGKKEVYATPLIENDTLFIGSGDYSFYALDAATGKKKWSFQTMGPIYDRALLYDGTVHVISGDTLYAIDAATGEGKWQYETVEGIDRPKRRRLGAVLEKGVIYLTASASYKSYLYAVDAKTGVANWTFSIDGEISKPIVSGEQVFFKFAFPGDPVKLYALATTSGELEWKYGPPEERLTVLFDSPLIVANNTAYFTTNQGLYAIDISTGEKRWNIGGKERDSQSQIVVADYLYFRFRRELHALDALSGKEIWSITPSIRGIKIKGVHKGIVYVAHNPDLTAIDGKTGKKLWSNGIGKSWDANATIWNGVLFVTSETVTYFGEERRDQGYLYAFQAELQN